MKTEYKVWEKFFFPSKWIIEKHTTTWFHILDWQTYYHFSPEWRLSTIFVESMYETFEEAKKFLVDDAKDKVKRANDLLKRMEWFDKKNVVFYESETPKEVLEERERMKAENSNSAIQK